MLLVGATLSGSPAHTQTTDVPWATGQPPPTRPTTSPTYGANGRSRGSVAKRTAFQPEAVLAPTPIADGVAAARPGSPENLPTPRGMPPIYDHEGPFDGHFAGGEPCAVCDDACGFDEQYGCDPCWPLAHGRWSFRGDYLLWWTKSANLPPLVTTSPIDTPQDQAGILGQDTAILFGGGTDPGSRSGARFTLSFSSDPCQESALEASYFFIGDKGVNFSQTSANGDPILARPFFNVDTSLQDAVQIAFPDVAIDSQLTATLANELQSFELLGREALFREGGRRVDVLYGYRYSRFAERLAIDHVFTSGPDNLQVPEGTLVQGSDVFAAGNEFHGAELGIAGQTQYYRWSLEGVAKVALGGTRSRATINGTTTITVPGEDAVTTQGGLLAQPTNIGSYSQSNFTAIPEVGLTAGFQLTPRLKATVGYSLIYWSRVARPGDQIDAGTVAGSPDVLVNVNPTQFSGGDLVGVPAPQFRFITSDFWTQGLSFGLDCRF